MKVAPAGSPDSDIYVFKFIRYINVVSFSGNAKCKCKTKNKKQKTKNKKQNQPINSLRSKMAKTIKHKIPGTKKFAVSQMKLEPQYANVLTPGRRLCLDCVLRLQLQPHHIPLISCWCFAFVERSFTTQEAKLAGMNAKPIEIRIPSTELRKAFCSAVNGIGSSVAWMWAVRSPGKYWLISILAYWFHIIGSAVVHCFCFCLEATMLASSHPTEEI